MNASATPVIVTLNLPRVGIVWPEHHGIFCGITGGQEGRPYEAIILPDDPRVHFEGVQLGTYGIDVEAATSMHDGRANTIALAAAGSEICQQILDLEIAGQKDLILPAAHDARAMAINVPQLFKFDYYYLTSTQYDADNVFVQDFEYGGSSLYDKDLKRRAVAVRKIQLSA